MPWFYRKNEGEKKITHMLKRVLKQIRRRHAIKKAFLGDYRSYCRWEYNNPDNRCREAMEARMLRLSHVLEKGMSLSAPKPGFGVAKAEELITQVRQYHEQTDPEGISSVARNAVGVLGAYLRFHSQRGFTPKTIEDGYHALLALYPESGETYGIEDTTSLAMMEAAHGTLPEVMESRHSVRQFRQQPVSSEDVKKAVALAMRAPSACNRQSCKAYFYQDPRINEEIGKLIPGNSGFSQDVPNYIVITGSQSAFYDAFERNQVYIDGGLFTMALVEALHYYGIGSCILQNGEIEERNALYKEICGNIAANEKIILFIAVGYYPERFSYALSHRKNIEDVLKIK